MAETDGGAVRLGGLPSAGAATVCAGCKHPFPLHGNGTTRCRAFACTAGPSVGCTDCGGTTRDMVSGEPCTTCRGTGSVSLPCQGFAYADQVSLAS